MKKRQVYPAVLAKLDSETRDLITSTLEKPDTQLSHTEMEAWHKYYALKLTFFLEDADSSADP